MMLKSAPNLVVDVHIINRTRRIDCGHAVKTITFSILGCKDSITKIKVVDTQDFH